MAPAPLKMAPWAGLQILRLYFMHLTASVMQQLIHAPFPNLSSLTIGDCRMGPEAISYMSSAHWLHLTELFFHASDINAAVVGRLKPPLFSGVQQVYLIESLEDAAGMRYLAQANWTLLTTLHIMDSELDVAAMNCLVRGPWPLLEELNLKGTQLDSHKISILLNGDWPEL